MSKAVMDAVLARLGASWTGDDGVVLPVVNLNGQGEPPADGSPFIAVELRVANEDQFTLGNPGANNWKEEGAFSIILNEARGIGISRAEAWVETLRALFRGKYFASVETFGPAPATLNDSSDLGNYFQFSFAVPYRFFVTG